MPEKTIMFAGGSMIQPVSDAANSPTPYSFAQYTQNCFYEYHVNPATKSGDAWVISRPGFQKAADAISASNNAQGIYWWSADHGSGFGFLYCVVNGELFKGSGATQPITSFSSVGTLTGMSTTQGCWFDEFFDGTNYLLLIKCEDGNFYTVTTGGTITRITDTDYTGLTAVGQIAVMDSFIYAVKSDGTIANCDYRTPGTWTSTSTIKAEELMDQARGLVRVGNAIYCMGEFSIQRFVNAQNPVGSPLAKAGVWRVGCVNHKSIARNADEVFFVGKTAEGVVGAFKLREGGIEKVSTSDIDRFIESGDEGAKAAILQMEGHVFYVINPLASNNSTAAKSAVYDVTTGQWHFWYTTDFSVITGVGFFARTAGNQCAYVTPQVQGSSVGSAVYMLAPFGSMNNQDNNTTDVVYYRTGYPTYLDGSAGTIQYEIKTDDVILGNGNRITPEMIELLCRQTTASTSVTLTITQPTASGTQTTTRSYDASVVPCKAHRLPMHRRARFSWSWASQYLAARAMRISYEVSTT